MLKKATKKLKRLNFYKTSCTVFSVILFVSSCTKEVVPTCSPVSCPTDVSYSTQIKPLITLHCATNAGPGTGCHDAWIFDYSNVLASINSGEFENVITNKSMPKIPNSFGITALTDDEIQTFKCWICQGAPNN
jgi:hypothetical protein